MSKTPEKPQSPLKTLRTIQMGGFCALALFLAPASQSSSSAPAAAFSVISVRPQKIVTPNGDSVNDVFQVFFENPSDSVISAAKIYDLTGAEVSDFKLGAAGDSLEWNGLDRNGKRARGGVYLYRIEVEDQVFSGVVVVAQ
jgi:flagellar hook assembly protein FlgD